MKALTLIMAVALLPVVFLGCVSSINPLFTEYELIFDSDLLGNWSDGESQLSFTREGDNIYTLISSDEGEELGFETHLVQLDNNIFLDVYPLDILSGNYLFHATHFPVHTFFKIEIEQEQMTLSEIDSKLLDSLINDSRVDISYVRSPEGRILLTGSTKKLQDLVQKY